MKGRWMLRWIALAILAAPVSARAAAPDTSSAPLQASLGAGSRLWIEGTSTVHEYESGTEKLTVEVRRDPSTARATDAAGLDALIRGSAVQRVDVAVPVLTLHSKKSGLDKNLWKAMKSDAYPNVRCELTRYAITPDAASNDTLGIRAERTLEIAGQRRPITLDARAWPTPDRIW